MLAAHVTVSEVPWRAKAFAAADDVNGFHLYKEYLCAMKFEQLSLDKSDLVSYYKTAKVIYQTTVSYFILCHQDEWLSFVNV